MICHYTRQSAYLPQSSNHLRANRILALHKRSFSSPVDRVNHPYQGLASPGFFMIFIAQSQQCFLDLFDMQFIMVQTDS